MVTLEKVNGVPATPFPPWTCPRGKKCQRRAGLQYPSSNSNPNLSSYTNHNMNFTINLTMNHTTNLTINRNPSSNILTTTTNNITNSNPSSNITNHTINLSTTTYLTSISIMVTKLFTATNSNRNTINNITTATGGTEPYTMVPYTFTAMKLVLSISIV